MAKIENNVDLKQYNTYRIGGKADYFVAAENKQDLIDAFNFAKDKGIPYATLGKGSNVVVSSEGFRGLVIVNKYKEVKIGDHSIWVASGTSISALTAFTKDKGLSGLEFLSGVPGSFGGAIIGNAGSFGGVLSDVILSVEFIGEDGKLTTLPKDKLGFSYRESAFKKSIKGIITGANIKLRQLSPEEVDRKVSEILNQRKAKDPKGKTCGSFFKNIPEAKATSKILGEIEVRGIDGNIPTGKLIDETGCKGLKVGGAEVSTYNAGFIINTGNASPEDIKTLAEEVKKRVFERFGVELEEEVRYL